MFNIFVKKKLQKQDQEIEFLNYVGEELYEIGYNGIEPILETFLMFLCKFQNGKIGQVVLEDYSLGSWIKTELEKGNNPTISMNKTGRFWEAYQGE